MKQNSEKRLREGKMKVLGITGGVGVGKSSVLAYLQEQEGVVVYEADKIARDLQCKGSECLEMIVSNFGDSILLPDGSLNRKALGNIVFNDTEKLSILNAIVHPMVREEIKNLILYHEKKGMDIFVLESAILFESDFNEICDVVWYVFCQKSIRLERLKSSRNYSDQLFDNICNQQLSEEIFKRKSNLIIDNSFSEECLHHTLEEELKYFKENSKYLGENR